MNSVPNNQFAGLTSEISGFVHESFIFEYLVKDLCLCLVRVEFNVVLDWVRCGPIIVINRGRYAQVIHLVDNCVRIGLSSHRAVPLGPYRILIVVVGFAQVNLL